jgi:hypothetical protein
MNRWKIQLDNKGKDMLCFWLFKTLKEAKEFLDDRKELVQHLNFNPDLTYSLIDLNKNGK